MRRGDITPHTHTHTHHARQEIVRNSTPRQGNLICVHNGWMDGWMELS